MLIINASIFLKLQPLFEFPVKFICSKAPWTTAPTPSANNYDSLILRLLMIYSMFLTDVFLMTGLMSQIYKVDYNQS